MFRSFLLLFSGSLAGKLAGVLREVLLAGLFGTSGVVAALRAAQSATLVPVNFFTADSLAAGFLPLYARYREVDARRASTLFWWTGGLLTVASVVTVTLLLIATPLWIGILVPGFDAREREMTVDFVRIMGLGVPFYIAGGLFSYLEMGHGQYVLASSRATLQSFGLIAGTIVAYALHAPILLAWGFSVAYVFYAVWGFARIVRCGWVKTPTCLTRHDFGGVAGEFWNVVKPLVLVPVLLQGNIVAERAVASLLGLDVAAALDYAKFISDTGILLFAVPLGLASLSAISKMSDTQTHATLATVIPPILLTTVPVSMVLAVNSHAAVAIIYQRGHFDAASTRLTQIILWGYAAGFWAQVASYVLVKALSAKLRNGAVFRSMAAALVANMLVNLCLYRSLGPVVLGIGGCVYGVVLLVLSAHALNITRVVVQRLMWLIPGTVGYMFMALALTRQDRFSLVEAALWAVLWWGTFIAMVPTLRKDVVFLSNKIRMAK
ncbi:murein biosynthesis integral membrane protein MurJ [Paraburkholderia terrae]|uniref:murein biosynthesis integral membrane protein MurJ n=1 Tax=Paraburkholderia terrae TaxID=311230 RepID=UPI00296B0C88|nr:lipid II flippase MurJ [Paraburkholderia terrae]MDW3655383.1 lipid II flippase MurJ [Paraburkholderia terrae]